MSEQGSEHQRIKEFTIRNLLVTIVGTATIVASVLATYYGLKDSIFDMKSQQEVRFKVIEGHQETTDRVNELRLRVLETQVALLQQQIAEIGKREKK